MTTQGNQAEHTAAWHTLPPEFVFARQNTDPEMGLSEEEASRRLAKYGLNRVDPGSPPTVWQDIRRCLVDPQIVAGLITGAAFAALGNLTAAVITWLVTLALGALQLIQQRLARRALESLQVLNEPAAIVRRSGRRRLIPADEVVPGDLILLEAGQRIPADARLVQAYSLQTDEASLSGDSQPVDKTTDAVLSGDTPLVQRVTMVYGGTLVVRGQGDAVVTATGALAESGLGSTFRPVAAARLTPLQSELRTLTRYLVVAALVVCTVLALLAGLRTGLPFENSLLAGLALVFASLPGQGLLVASALLALGAYRIARQHAILRNLAAVETLAAIDTVVTEKSGLLTSNQLTLQRIVPPIWQPQLLEIGVMSTGVDLGRFRQQPAHLPPTGELPDLRGTDPVDAALLQAAAAAELDILGLRLNRPVVAVFTFDGQRRRMSVVYRRGVRPFAAVKGDPEAVLGVCVRRWTSDGIDKLTPVDRQAILETAQALAASVGRVIALAERALVLHNGHTPLAPEEVERDLNFAGFMAFADELRPETADAIQTCRQAGVQVFLVSGDHPAAAQAVAEQTGLVYGETPVIGPELDRLDRTGLAGMLAQHRLFARITPVQKLRIVKTLQAQGACVSVTGDSLRDQLALDAADIGAALGQSGTDAARSASDVILADDNFATLVQAMAAGRQIFSQISQAISINLAGKLGLVSTIALPLIFALPLPFNPLQIILAGFILETLVSLPMINEPVQAQDLRTRPHNPGQALFNTTMQARIFRGAIALFTSVTIAYLSSLLITGNVLRAQTTAFVTYLLTYALLVYSLRSDTQLIIQQNLLSNRVLFTCALLVAALAFAVTQLPILMGLAGTTTLHPMEWLLVLFAVLVGVSLAELRKWLGNLRPQTLPDRDSGPASTHRK